LSPEDARAIGQLPPHKLDILVSLTCTICPDLVTAVQHVAALNDGITAEVYDIAHYPAWKDKYHVLGVPCLVVDDGQQVHFGKKSLPDLVKMLQMPAGTKAREN
jgi:thioredoxin reductase (NADPH)